MTPKEFQKSNLTVELKAGKKRLEDALRGLGDEQCERAGATRSGSVMDLLSEIVTNEFLALMEVSDRLPGLPMDHLANADGRIPIASGAKKAAANKSVENLLTEFGVLRSAIIRRTEGREPQGAKHAYVVNVCVTRFNEQIDEIERWRSSEIVGFSAARLRAEAREGLPRSSAWQTCWNRSIRCSRWGWLPSCLFAQLRARRTPRGISSLTGRPFSEEGIRQAKPFVGAPFGHGGVAWLSPNASRIYHRRNPESLDDARVDARRGGTADLRGIDFAV